MSILNESAPYRLGNIPFGQGLSSCVVIQSRETHLKVDNEFMRG